MFFTGQLNVLLHHIRSHGGPRVPDEIVQRLQDIRRKAADVSNNAVPYVAESQPYYTQSRYIFLY